MEKNAQANRRRQFRSEAFLAVCGFPHFESRSVLRTSREFLTQKYYLTVHPATRATLGPEDTLCAWAWRVVWNVVQAFPRAAPPSAAWHRVSRSHDAEMRRHSACACVIRLRATAFLQKGYLAPCEST